MANVRTEAERKARMRTVLFWLFVAIFALTALLAFSALAKVVFFERFEPSEIFERFAWALWGTVLAEVATSLFVLWKNLFDLSGAKTVADLTNKLAEVVDGLESNGIIPAEAADELRSSFSGDLGVSGTVRRAAEERDAPDRATRRR